MALRPATASRLPGRQSRTEAINGLIELQRRIARGFRNRDHYRRRMLLIGGGLTSPHLK
ncbi:transposase [Streptomyces sp. BH097]|uniref:transposase n=1 Tax=unclassified Streptomyces TaxID=2593676 RepID=UPI003BB64A1C